MPIRVLLADEQAMVGGGFRMILELEPDLDAAKRRTARKRSPSRSRRRPMSSSWTSGCHAWTGSRRPGGCSPRSIRHPTLLMVTTSDDDQSLYVALRAGARGFLLKNALPSSSSMPSRTLASGDGLLAPAVTRRVIEEFARTTLANERPPPAVPDELTDRELEVLRLVARGLSNAEIADRLVITHGTARRTSHESS